MMRTQQNMFRFIFVSATGSELEERDDHVKKARLVIQQHGTVISSTLFDEITATHDASPLVGGS